MGKRPKDYRRLYLMTTFYLATATIALAILVAGGHYLIPPLLYLGAVGGWLWTRYQYLDSKRRG
jgi:hypothetical protein